MRKRADGKGADDRRHVLVFRNHLLPFSETFIRNPAEALCDYQAIYVGSRRVDGLSLPDERVVVCRDGRTLSELEELAFKLSGFMPARFLEKLRSLDPILVHAHFGPDALRAIPIARALDLPLIVTYQGIDATLDFRNAWRLGIRGIQYVIGKRKVFEFASRILTVSRYLADKIESAGAPTSKVEVQYTGVDCEEFRPQTPGSRAPMVLFVGRLVEKKGVEYLIDAMSRIERETDDAELKIVGDGPLAESLHEKASRKLERFEFLGRQSPDEVRTWMDKARVLCVPSVVASTGDSEGLPNVVLEAQAMATPVVGFAHAGIPEAVEQGETGLLAEEGDLDTLTDHLRRMVGDAEMARSMGNAARRHMLENFEMKKQVRRLERIYDEVGARCRAAV